MFALSPATINYSVEPMTQLPSGMFLTIATYCLLRAESVASFGNVLLLGISIGYLALIRPSSLLLLALIPPYLLWRTRKFVGGVTVFIVGILIVVAWIGYVHEKTGRYVGMNTSNAKNFYYGHNPKPPLYRTWWMARHHKQQTPT